MRDSTNLNQAIAEYARTIKSEGRLTIVELGKADSIVKRFFAVIYLRFIMPLIAKVMISGRLEGNPWRMILPTYQNFPTMRRLLEMLEGRFDLLEKKHFLAGGIIVILLRARGS